MELYNGIMYGVTEEGSGLSVLRTFRLLRILKLVRFLPNLRRQLIVMLKTMDNVAVFFGLLALFIFIFRWELKKRKPIHKFDFWTLQHSRNESLWMQVLWSGDWSLRQKKLWLPFVGYCHSFPGVDIWGKVLILNLLYEGSDSRGLEHCPFCWHGENQPLGCSILCGPDDFW